MDPSWVSNNGAEVIFRSRTERNEAVAFLRPKETTPDVLRDREMH